MSPVWAVKGIRSLCRGLFADIILWNHAVL